MYRLSESITGGDSGVGDPSKREPGAVAVRNQPTTSGAAHAPSSKQPPLLQLASAVDDEVVVQQQYVDSDKTMKQESKLQLASPDHRLDNHSDARMTKTSTNLRAGSELRLAPANELPERFKAAGRPDANSSSDGSNSNFDTTNLRPPGAFHSGEFPCTFGGSSSSFAVASHHHHHKEDAAIVATIVEDDENLVHKNDVEDIIQERLKQEREDQKKNAVVAEIHQADTKEEDINNNNNNNSKQCLCLLLTITLLGVVVLILSLLLVGPKNGVQADSGDHDPIVSQLDPTLQRIQNRGHINCRVRPEEFDKGVGFTIDLCRALSSAIFDGDDSKMEFVQVPWVDQWESIVNGTLDVALEFVTSNMERQVLEPTSGAAFLFTTPYFYTGNLFAGVPEFVQCAQDGETLRGNCSNVKVCVGDSSALEQVVRDKLDSTAVVEVPFALHFESLRTGVCNVIATEPLYGLESDARAAGYEGEYVFADTFLTKVPLAMLSRGDDVEFSNFANWILQSLFAAEAVGITQKTASVFPTTDVFGEAFQDVFRNAITAVGNYGELYDRHFKEVFPRRQINMVSNGTSGGLLYSHPFGDLDVENVETIGVLPNGTIKAIDARGVLRCGLVVDESLPEYFVNLDADFCKAVAVGMFATADKENRIEYITFNMTEAAFEALGNGSIDVFAGAPYNLENNVKEPATGLGFAFSPTYYHGEFVGEQMITRALATNQNDNQWSTFVRWIVWSTMYAEEAGIGQMDAEKMPRVDLFGPNYNRMFQCIALALGNYAEIYERNFGLALPRSGANMLNDGESPLIQPLLSSFGF